MSHYIKNLFSVNFCKLFELFPSCTQIQFYFLYWINRFYRVGNVILELLFYRQMSSNPFNVIYFVMCILLKVHVSICIFLQLKINKIDYICHRIDRWLLWCHIDGGCVCFCDVTLYCDFRNFLNCCESAKYA